MKKKKGIYIYKNIYKHVHTEKKTNRYTHSHLNNVHTCARVYITYIQRYIYIKYMNGKTKERTKKYRKEIYMWEGKKGYAKITKCEPQHLYEPLNRDA